MTSLAGSVGWLAIWVAAAGSIGACSTAGTANKHSPQASGQSKREAFLDSPVADNARPSRSSTVDDALFVLPDPPEDTTKTIDGDVGDWDRAEARKFDGKRYVTRGEQFWTGGADASFRVGVDSDAGHLYLWVDVRDDKVIDAASEDVMADGVIVWLRDPRLDEVVASLPAALAERGDADRRVGILFTPDGQFWPANSRAAKLYRTGIDAATKRMNNGYRLEVALRLGAVGEVARLPTDEVGFRVEVMDGDDTDRRGEQTHMSMLADRSGPRFATYEIGGWLPYAPAHGKPPRPGALGRWKLADGRWTFRSFEVRPVHWSVLRDVSSFQDALNRSRVLADLCPQATADRTLIEAYQSTGGGHRAGLVLCGPRTPGGRCPDDAVSHLYWVHLRSKKQGWSLIRSAEVTHRPLPQCPRTARSGGDLFADFSLLPLEMLGTSVWGVGYRKRYASSSQINEERGIWFVNPSLDKPYLAGALNERIQATADERTVAKSRVYLAWVDDEKGLDICEVQRIETQACRGLNRGCQTLAHGGKVNTHIEMWKPDEARFDTYLLARHKRCDADFEFSERKGFLLINQAGRLGALASPAND